MKDKERTLRDDHNDLLERLQREGNSIKDNELVIIYTKVMEDYRVIRDWIPVDHKAVLDNILQTISSLRGIK